MHPDIRTNSSRFNETIANIRCTNLPFDDVCNDFIDKCSERKITFDHYESDWPHPNSKLAFYRNYINPRDWPEDDRRREKFGEKFTSFEEIERLIFPQNRTDYDATRAMQLIQENDLIERNFVQLTVRLLVSDKKSVSLENSL